MQQDAFYLKLNFKLTRYRHRGVVGVGTVLLLGEIVDFRALVQRLPG